jgi:hypothetical protein
MQELCIVLRIRHFCSVLVGHSNSSFRKMPRQSCTKVQDRNEQGRYFYLKRKVYPQPRKCKCQCKGPARTCGYQVEVVALLPNDLM